MNNGLYVGPIISRSSPRWRMSEFYAQPQGSTAASAICSTLMEPYIPPSVSAVMLTATAGSRSSSASASGASCHNIVIPCKSRRVFIEAHETLRVYVISDYDLTQLAAAQLAAANCDILLTLSAGSGGGSASVSSRGSTYISVTAGQQAPFLNGVLYGGNPTSQTFSNFNPRLRQSGTSTQPMPGNLFAPVRAQLGLALTPSGSSSTTATGNINGSYFRLEYFL